MKTEKETKQSYISPTVAIELLCDVIVTSGNNDDMGFDKWGNGNMEGGN